MSEQELRNGDQGDQTPSPPTQAQLYDDLRRIGQLEDQKHAIQTEIDQRTERLRQAVPLLDASSLLYQILSSTIKSPAKSKPANATRRAAKKKTASKKRR
jgi:hypothetical protein